MRHLDLFSGIGGFALAAETVWEGEYENVGFCDNEPFSQAVLKKHWPESKIYGDIKQFIEPPPADLITGGFPCQPFSLAGKRRGKEDDRHLWPEMFRVIRQSAPKWIVAENVSGLLTWNGGMVLDEVFADLESEGYEVWPLVLPAASVGAPHRRERVWVVAHSNKGADRGTAGPDESSLNPQGLRQRNELGQLSKPDTIRVPDTDSDSGRIRRHERQGTPKRSAPRSSWQEDWPEVAARLCTLDDGVPIGVV